MSNSECSNNHLKIFHYFSRTKLLSCVDKAINPESYMNEVVYDLDQLCAAAAETAPQKR